MGTALGTWRLAGFALIALAGLLQPGSPNEEPRGLTVLPELLPYAPLIIALGISANKGR